MEVSVPGRDWLLALFFTFTLVFVLYFKPEPELFVSYALRGLFGLTVALLLLHIAKQWWRRLAAAHATRPSAAMAPPAEAAQNSAVESAAQEAEDMENEREARQHHYQEIDRERKQEDHRHKAEEYYERVVRPKEEAKLKKQQEEFYRFMGPAWKGEAHPLEETSEEDKKARRSLDGAGRDAAERRHLPESASKTSRPPAQPAAGEKKEKKKVVLGEEPAASDPGVLTVMLRTPLGRSHRRRFHCTEPVQMLLDYMQTVGYSPKLYQLSSSFPRRCISSDPTLTLAEADITRDVTLNVEGKD